MANVSNSKSRIDEVKKIVTNGLSSKVYEIDMKLTALKQAHDDRTGCVLKDQIK